MSEKTVNPVSPKRREFLKNAALVPAGLYVSGCVTTGESTTSAAPAGTGVAGSMIDYAVAPLDKVRIAIVGVGRRGLPMLRLPPTILAVCNKTATNLLTVCAGRLD